LELKISEIWISIVSRGRDILGKPVEVIPSVEEMRRRAGGGREARRIKRERDRRKGKRK
jgi:hypothetical protein